VLDDAVQEGPKPVVGSCQLRSNSFRGPHSGIVARPPTIGELVLAGSWRCLLVMGPGKEWEDRPGADTR
jgi:hypothetical protein